MCKEFFKFWIFDVFCCLVYIYYGMVIKEVYICYGLVQLYYCFYEECIIVCFGINEECDDFLYEVVMFFYFMYRDFQCFLMCYCNELLVLKFFKFEKNFYWLYMICCKKQDRECIMFQWVDDFFYLKVLSYWGGKSVVLLGGKN